MGSLGIAIDGGRYVRVDSSIADFPRTVKLRTLRPGQDSAKLEFCTFRRKGPVVLRTVVISGLSGSGESHAELKLSVQRDRFALWHIEARKPDGSREEFRVRTGIGLWVYVLPATALLILVLLFLIPMLIRGFSGFSEPSSSRESDSFSSESRSEPSAAAPMTENNPVPLVSEESASSTTEGESGTGQSGNEAGSGNTTQKAAEGNPEDEIQAAAVDSPTILLPAVTTVFFQPESAALSSMARAELSNLAALIPENISLDIGGHCANYGTEKGRRVLSQNRALAVSTYLSSRIPSSVQIRVQSWGSSRPLSSNPGLQDKNRRVEIIVEDRSE